MNKPTLRFLACILLAALTASPAFAASRKKKAAPPPLPPTIASVAADSITVSANNSTKTYTVNQFTQITLKGQLAKITDLQPGMAVSIVQGTDPTKASRIIASDAPGGAPKAR